MTEKKIQIMLRVSPELDTRIQNAATLQHLSKAAYVTHLVEGELRGGDHNEVKLTLPRDVVERIHAMHGDNPYADPRFLVLDYLRKGMDTEDRLQKALARHIEDAPGTAAPQPPALRHTEPTMGPVEAEAAKTRVPERLSGLTRKIAGVVRR